MTQREGAILSAFTGVLICDSFSPVHGYIEEIIGRPVFTHEMPSLMDEIKEKSQRDFNYIIHNITEKTE